MGVNSGELPDILWVCFPSHSPDAGAIHPLRPDVPAFNEDLPVRGRSKFNSIAEIMALT